MKKLLISALLLFFVISIQAQVSKSDVLQKLEKAGSANAKQTATLNSATRLFADRMDLTSVIMVIPSGSTVNVVGQDSTFLKVNFEDNEGFIYASHAVINKTAPVSVLPATRKEQPSSEAPVISEQPVERRYVYLENKYGTNVGQRIYQGKIWKGMSAEMVKDSWGSPQKINKVISGNIIKEEWFYKGTWLYIQNGVLAEWGPVK